MGVNKKTGKEILNKVFDYYNVNAHAFSENVGIKYDTLYSVISGKTKEISPENARKICVFYDNMNYDFLRGESDEMFVESKKSEAIKGNPYFTEFTIQGGTGHGFGDEKAMQPDGYMSVPGIKVSSEIKFFQVEGHSMEDPNDMSRSIPQGSWVAIRKPQTSDMWWGHIYAIMTLDGPIVKTVMPSDKGNDYIKIISLNSNFPPRELHRSEIIGEMWLVVGCVNVRRF